MTLRFSASRMHGVLQQLLRVCAKCASLPFLIGAALLAGAVLPVGDVAANGAPKAPPPVARCDSRHECGLLADGPYGAIIIGRLAHVASNEEMAAVFRWAKSHGYWKSLPPGAQPYLSDVKLVTLELPPEISPRPVTVFMGQDEFSAGPYVVGDLVRYSPHSPEHETPEGDADALALYHGLTGCVATICRQDDAACYLRYPQGVFSKATGQQVMLHGQRLVPGGIRIDPVSLLPVHQEK